MDPKGTEHEDQPNHDHEVNEHPYLALGVADRAAVPTTSSDDLRALGNTLVHSVGCTVVLLVILVLNVYKPRGMTRYGWRKQQEH